MLVLLAACAGPSLRKDILRFDPTYASPPATDGILAEIASDVFETRGSECSLFKLLGESYDGMAWRLALIDIFQGLADHGVWVAMLTNSLASHDVPAVNSDETLETQPARGRSQRVMNLMFRIFQKSSTGAIQRSFGNCSSSKNPTSGIGFPGNA